VQLSTASEKKTEVPVPTAQLGVPPQLLPGPAFNIALRYSKFAHDIQNGTHLCADFDAAVERHRVLDVIERSATLGRRLRVAA
jgi:predicted dehydrogenase